MTTERHAPGFEPRAVTTGNPAGNGKRRTTISIQIQPTNTGVLVSFTSSDQHAVVRATEFVPVDQLGDVIDELQAARATVRVRSDELVPV